MTIHLIHGFNVSDGGRGSVGKLTPSLSGRVSRLDYGWTGLLGLRSANDRAVRALLPTIEPGDVIVAHSNGALIAWHLAQILGDSLGAVVVINPALRRDTYWPDGLPVLCVHNSKDWVVQLGRMWGRLVSLGGFNPHGWGAAGRFGFDLGSANWDSAESWWAKPVEGHSALFKPDAVGYWGGLIDRWIRSTPRRTL